MSHLFSVPTTPDPKFCEGVITEVDAIRLFCKVRTTKGQNLTEVAWMIPSGGSSRGGALFVPVMGDRVVVNTSLGYPVVMGYLPKVSTAEIFSTEIDDGVPEVDTGDYSPMSNGLTVFGEKTGDAVSGDQILTTEGGGVLGVLRGGTIIAKASRLAQIIITKWDDLIRIVARNYEVFADSFIDVAVNVRGRVYRFIGYTHNATEGRTDLYRYQEYFGDTALAESLQGDYIGASPGSFPVANTIVHKVKVVNASEQALNTRTIDLNGTVIEKVQNAAGSAVTTFKHDSSTITIQYNTTATVTIDPSSITVEYTGGGKTVIDANQVASTFAGHFAIVDAAGTHLG